MDDLDTGKPARPDGPRNHSPHPWWSRLLYLLYGLASLAAGVVAWTMDYDNVAIVSAGVGAVLVWKASQKVR